MLKIMIVEDDIINRKVMYKILTKYGDCDIVINGVEAIDAFLMSLNDDEQYDLICMDIMMPKLDGISAVKTIRQLEAAHETKKKTKIIMTTALSEQDVMDDSFNVGSDAYATKPIDIEKLITVIRNFGLIE